MCFIEEKPVLDIAMPFYQSIYIDATTHLLTRLPTHLSTSYTYLRAANGTIEDPVDEGAVVDTASNASSQGARSTTVCLPIKISSARSRMVSPPKVRDKPAQEQAVTVTAVLV